jgi:2-polyprenyl-3-methyl-5-hydroxy-6-metoxy-1,4-benzoquinol methylase
VSLTDEDKDWIKRKLAEQLERVETKLLTEFHKFRKPSFNYAIPRYVENISSCFFYHTMDVPGYGLQTGPWDLRGKFFDYVGHVDCKGKRVLDVGCASGFLSFSAEEFGAEEVVSFDMDSARRQHMLPFHNKTYYNDYESWFRNWNSYIEKWKNAYWLAHRVLGSHSKVYYGDVYSLPDALGRFDIVIVGAILEHLADPIRALASISRVTDSTIVINTDVLETEERIARFDGDASRPEIDYVFWTYSLGTYRHVLAMLGFDIIRTVKKAFRFTDVEGMYPRTAIVAQRASSG